MTINLGFFASHAGSNMQAVIEACNAGILDARPSLVISNNSDSLALVRAKCEGIPAYHLSSKMYPDPAQLDQTIFSVLMEHQVDLVILAGYMRRLGEKTLAAYQGGVINIHPALLPKFGGEGMYGMHVHEAVIAAHERESGVTIHLVDREYDHGEILAQHRLPVRDDDTAETLAQRILEVEHVFLVETIGKIIKGEIVIPIRKIN